MTSPHLHSAVADNSRNVGSLRSGWPDWLVTSFSVFFVREIRARRYDSMNYNGKMMRRGVPMFEKVISKFSLILIVYVQYCRFINSLWHSRGSHCIGKYNIFS